MKPNVTKEAFIHKYMSILSHPRRLPHMEPAMYKTLSERPREAETTNVNSDCVESLKIAFLISELESPLMSRHTAVYTAIMRNQP